MAPLRRGELHLLQPLPLTGEARSSSNSAIAHRSRTKRASKQRMALKAGQARRKGQDEVCGRSGVRFGVPSWQFRFCCLLQGSDVADGLAGWCLCDGSGVDRVKLQRGAGQRARWDYMVAEASASSKVIFAPLRWFYSVGPDNTTACASAPDM